MKRVPDASGGEPPEADFSLREWLLALGSVGAVLAGAVLVLAIAYYLLRGL
ncbi:MAG: hypothetical protein ACK47B_28845 [Armatimonadota bacterium]